jgi:hypothetical protein
VAWPAVFQTPGGIRLLATVVGAGFEMAGAGFAVAAEHPAVVTTTTARRAATVERGDNDMIASPPGESNGRLKQQKISRSRIR